MAKRSNSRSQAEDAGQTPQPKAARPRRARTNAPPSEAPDTFAAHAPDELPNIPEPGDAVDRTQQTEFTADQAIRSHVSASESPSARSEARSATSEAQPPRSKSQLSTSESRSMASEPSEDDIRLRAYHRYLERGGGHGAHFDDWLEAERELKERK
jgi:hypothetical protein